MIVSTATGEYHATKALTYRVYLWKRPDRSTSYFEGITESAGVKFVFTQSNTRDRLGNRTFRRTYQITLPYKAIIQVIVVANGKPYGNYLIPITFDETKPEIILTFKPANQFEFRFKGSVKNSKELKNFFIKTVVEKEKPVETHGMIY